MKNEFIFLRVFLFFLFSTIIINNSISQWTQSDGIYGGDVTSLSGNNNYVFMSSGYGLNGVYVSSNNGSSWSQTVLNNQDIKSLATNGSNIFAGADGSGVFHSTDNGFSWNQTELNNLSVYSLAVNGNNVFAGTISNGVFSSTNNGSTWNQTNLNSLNVIALITSGNNIYAGTNSFGVYHSTNNGTSWLQTSLNNRTVRSLAVNGNNIYAGTYANGVYHSSNNGANWIQTSLNNLDVNSITVIGNNVFAGTTLNGVYISTNNGLSWIQTNLNSHDVYSLTVIGNNVFAGTGTFGVYLSSNYGNSWVQTNLNRQDVMSFARSGGNIFAGTQGGIYLSANNGSSWTQTTFNNFSVRSILVSGSNIIVGTAGYGIYYSSDNGNTWSQTSMTSGYIYTIAINGNNIFAGLLFGGVYLSTNNGLNWTQTTLQTTINSLAVSENNIFAGSNSKLYQSTDNGSSWLQTSLINQNVKSIAINENNIFVGTNNGVFHSTNNGTSWTQTSLNNQIVNSLTINGNNIFAGTASNGIFLSTNNGTNWNQINQGFYVTPTVNALFLSDNNIYAGTSSYSVWKRALSDFNLNTLTPQISVSPIQITPGSSINISGQNFNANSQVKISITGPNFQIVHDQIYNTNNEGSFTVGYSSDNNAAHGIYTVSCYDVNNFHSAANKMFEIKQGQEVFFLYLTSPTTYSVNRNINVEWKDKMIPKPGYPINNIKRYYKYKINYTTDNGNTWSADEISEGYEFINSIPVFSKQITIPPPDKILSGTDINIKVTDFIDPSRYSESGSIYLLDNYLTKSSVNLIWDYSYPDRSGKPIGACADGVSRFYIKVSKLPGNTITGITANLSDDLNSNSERVLGKLIIANETEEYSNEASSAHLINYADNSSKDDYWIWYVSPDDFNRYGASDDSKIERFVNLNITVNYSTGPPETSVVGINIIRQPLMLVHGLNSDHKVWNYFRSNNNIDNLFKFVSTPDMDPKGKFIDNGYLLLNWGENSIKYEQSFRNIINKARQSGYAANQVSYVAHSMGGSMLRAASETLFYKSNLNYQNGFVNRFISVDTPHEGSPLADFLVDFLYYFGGALNIFLDESDNSFFIFDANNKIKPSPAVVNLQTNGIGKFYFNETRIPTFLAAGDFFPGTDDNLNNIDWNYSYDNKFNKLLNTLDNFLTISTTEILYSIFYKVSDYPKVKAIMLNPFMKKPERVFKLLNLVYSKLFESSSFLPNSDFVVPVNSQLAGIQRTSNNTFDRFNGDNNLPGVSHTIVYSCTDDNLIANKIIEHLNLPTNDNGFTQVLRSTPFNNTSPVFANSIPFNQNFDFDQSDEIEILNPQNGQNFFIDSVLNLSFNLVDTTDLKFVKVYFQGENYFDTAKSFTYNFNLTVNGNKLDSCDLIVYAAYINDSTIDFKTDLKKIFIKTNSPVLDFKVNNDFYFLSKDQIITPSYKSVFSNTIYEGSLSSISAIVDDPSVIQFNSANKTFKAISTGETFAIVSNGGPSDTIYFSINGEILTPEITTLVFPPDSAKVNKANLKLSWNIVNYASNYYLEVAKDINFESVVYENSSLYDTNTAISDIVDSVTYYWRVKALNSFGSGDWSSVRSFTPIPLRESYYYVTLIPEGFYNPVSNSLNIKDSIRVYLANINPPYNIIDSSISIVDSNSFQTLLQFNNTFSGNYYLKIKHRNSIETWSKSGGEVFTNHTKMYYDFTSSVDQAYGNNMILSGDKWCIYSGDINQDGTIDITDASLVDNDAFNFASGYILTDLNGDGITDISDAVYTDNNSFNFVSKITP